jgi:pSer/pThr/pTyr-binding forkhead associated (FHA) protein
MASRKLLSIEVSVLTGPDKGKHHSIRKLSASLGRDSGNELPIGDSIISRIHGTIEVTEKCHVYVYSDRSRNGTYYVKKGETQPTATILNDSVIMYPGDTLMMGHTSLRLEEGIEYEPETLSSTLISHSAQSISHPRSNSISNSTSHVNSSHPQVDATPVSGTHVAPHSPALSAMVGDIPKEVLNHPFMKLALEREKIKPLSSSASTSATPVVSASTLDHHSHGPAAAKVKQLIAVGDAVDPLGGREPDPNAGPPGYYDVIQQ